MERGRERGRREEEGRRCLYTRYLPIDNAIQRSNLWFKFKSDMSTHSSGGDSRLGSCIMVIHGRKRRVQTDNVHQPVVRD